MGLLGRKVFGEIVSRALLGATLFTFVLFLQRLGRLFEEIVRGSADTSTIAYLFALLLPPVLTFTIPVGVLVGTLIALSRMSADAEVTAMRASGLSSRRLLRPVLLFGFLATVLTGAISTWITPMAFREMYKLRNKLIAAQLTAEIQERVFAEQFPDTILYVGSVVPGPVVRWRNVFLADITPPDRRKKVSSGPVQDSPRITTATEAIAVPEVERNRIQLTLVNGSQHEVGQDYVQYLSTSFPQMQQALAAVQRNEAKPRVQFITMDMGPLWREAKTSVEARIEMHNRLVLPPACFLLALIGAPIGLSSRKGGKSSAFVLTVGIAFLYYMGLVALVGLARQQTLPVELAMWLPNALLLAGALMLVYRMERPGDRDILGGARAWVVTKLASFRGNLPSGSPSTWTRLPIGPLIIDHYILSTFLFYFFLLLVSFVLMTDVYTFFELLSDVLKNSIGMSLMAKYLVYLTPMLVYDSTPISILVAVLVTFGILTKNNEVTAMKACGVSLYRLAIPVFAASAVLSAALFAFDYYVIPDANKTQDAIRNQIKGRPTQTYLDPNRKWIFGAGSSRIYYYKYFDPAAGVMVEPHVYELEADTFRLKRHIFAERARWEPAMNTWIFQDGWSRDFKNGIEETGGFRPFKGQTSTFPELQEPPGYFLKEVKQDKQMNFHELSAYIRELQQSGFDTIRLQVQFHKKFAVPLFALIMALISVPFAFVAANRGATAGIAVSFGIAIAYWAVSQLFEQVGNVSQLPAVLAAWAPDAVFSLFGLYFLARMRT
ncbi:MAG TPA: LptF/LptG family permease [Bryobacteraceae bacterium]|nr:LptF/LptG family permease [Bryobacteraceae bacterium]